MWPSPKKLPGSRVSLWPLTHGHAKALAQATVAGPFSPEGYKTPVRHDMTGEISYRLERQADGLSLTYAVQSRSTRWIGWASYSRIDRAHKKLEIGDVWLACLDPKSYNQTMISLLDHAFENARANTVQIKAVTSNTALRARIENLGASLDGVLRNEIIAKNGEPQDVALYSIIKTEWPEISKSICAKLL